jgi:hypothetical protein
MNQASGVSDLGHNRGAVALDERRWTSASGPSTRRAMTRRGDATRLSSSITVARYGELVAAGDRRALGDFVVERFDERYFRPVEESCSKHGFASMAIACLAIETLESFHQGLGETRGVCDKMFAGFFAQDTPLKAFGTPAGWFYRDIRCGIPRQAETRGGECCGEALFSIG